MNCSYVALCIVSFRLPDHPHLFAYPLKSAMNFRGMWDSVNTILASHCVYLRKAASGWSSVYLAPVEGGSREAWSEMRCGGGWTGGFPSGLHCHSCCLQQYIFRAVIYYSDVRCCFGSFLKEEWESEKWIKASGKTAKCVWRLARSPCSSVQRWSETFRKY